MAKSFSLNPLFTIKTDASASPIAIATNELAVGTIPSGSTSLSIVPFKTISTFFAINESILLTIPIRGESNSLNIGIRRINSSVLPLFDINIVGSPGL